MRSIIIGLILPLLHTTSTLRCAHDNDVGDDFYENENEIECNTTQTHCMIEYNLAKYFKRCIDANQFMSEYFCANKTISITQYGNYTGECNTFTEPRLDYDVVVCCCDTDGCNGGFDPRVMKDVVAGVYEAPFNYRNTTALVLFLLFAFIVLVLMYNATKQEKEKKRKNKKAKIKY